MATAVVLSGITCRVDADQDPEQLVCVWRGRTLEGGDFVTLDTMTDPGDELDTALAAAATAADYEIV